MKITRDLLRLRKMSSELKTKIYNSLTETFSDFNILYGDSLIVLKYLKKELDPNTLFDVYLTLSPKGKPRLVLTKGSFPSRAAVDPNELYHFFSFQIPNTFEYNLLSLLDLRVAFRKKCKGSLFGFLGDKHLSYIIPSGVTEGIKQLLPFDGDEGKVNPDSGDTFLSDAIADFFYHQETHSWYKLRNTSFFACPIYGFENRRDMRDRLDLHWVVHTRFEGPTYNQDIVTIIRKYPIKMDGKLFHGDQADRPYNYDKDKKRVGFEERITSQHLYLLAFLDSVTKIRNDLMGKFSFKTPLLFEELSEIKKAREDLLQDLRFRLQCLTNLDTPKDEMTVFLGNYIREVEKIKIHLLSD